MILCPYCGSEIQTELVKHSDTIYCASCKNYSLVLVVQPSDWKRIKQKLAAHNFLVKTTKQFLDDAFAFCAVCGAPSFKGSLCRDCLTCLFCKNALELENDVVTCTYCDKSWTLGDFVIRKQILEDTIDGA